MKSIIKEIYSLQMEKEDFQNSYIDAEMRKEIEKFMKQNNICITESEGDRDGTDIAFELAEIGEEAGFIRGFQCAMQLFIECIGK